MNTDCTDPEETTEFQITLASPRGFCAGVERAIETVKIALKRHGAPVYVLHEIVHNKHVINDLRRGGAVFVEKLEAIPTGSICIFSAHGVSATTEKPKISVWSTYERSGCGSCCFSCVVA